MAETGFQRFKRLSKIQNKDGQGTLRRDIAGLRAQNIPAHLAQDSDQAINSSLDRIPVASPEALAGRQAENEFANRPPNGPTPLGQSIFDFLKATGQEVGKGFEGGVAQFKKAGSKISDSLRDPDNREEIFTAAGIFEDLAKDRRRNDLLAAGAATEGFSKTSAADFADAAETGSITENLERLSTAKLAKADRDKQEAARKQLAIALGQDKTFADLSDFNKLLKLQFDLTKNKPKGK